jgi:hypothetical protein
MALPAVARALGVGGRGGSQYQDRPTKACRIGAPRPTSRQGRAAQAKSHATDRCRNRDRRLTEARLTDGWREIHPEAADGVDAVSAPEYELPLGEHIRQLVARLPRKRVFLQSPVRDNRPPGSVRGPSGHWRSYCDDGC